MSLTQRERAKFNAALCLIHDMGHDASAVTGQVRAIAATGTPDAIAYKRALNAFAAATPSMVVPLQRVTRVIDASDDATVARYSLALSHYIDSGDDSGLRELAPMIAQDMVNHAARTGDTAPEFSPEMDALLAGEGNGTLPAASVADDSDGERPAAFAFRVPGAAAADAGEG